MDTLEIIVNTAESTNVLYTYLPKNYQSLFDFLINNVKCDLNFSIYWIDSKNEKNEVNNDNAFDIFCRTSKSKKLFVTAIKNTISEDDVQFVELKVAQNENDQDESTQSKKDKHTCDTVHIGILCDECDIDIVGFRYKCLQCANYDLCMSCQNNFVHNSHIMLRIPDRLTRREARGLENAGLFNDLPENNESGNKRHSHHYGRCQRKPALISTLMDMFRNMKEDYNPNCYGNSYYNNKNQNSELFFPKSPASVEVLKEHLLKLKNRTNSKREICENNTKSTFDTNPNDNAISMEDNKIKRNKVNSPKVSSEKIMDICNERNDQSEVLNNHGKNINIFCEASSVDDNSNNLPHDMDCY